MNIYHNVNICSKAHVPFQDSRTLKGNKYSSSGVLVRDCFAVIGTVLLYVFNCLFNDSALFPTYLPLCVWEREREREKEIQREREERERAQWKRYDTLVSYRKFNTCQHKSDTDSFGRKNKFTRHSKQRMGWDLKNRGRVGRLSTI